MKLGFVITNDKASYVAKEDSIRLLSVAKETALNEQQIKPCVPLGLVSFSLSKNCITRGPPYKSAKRKLSDSAVLWLK